MSNGHIRKRSLVLSVGVLLGVTFVVTLSIAAVIVSNSVGQPLWNSWSAHSRRLAQEEVRGARIEKEAREQTYLTLSHRISKPRSSIGGCVIAICVGVNPSAIG